MSQLDWLQRALNLGIVSYDPPNDYWSLSKGVKSGLSGLKGNGQDLEAACMLIVMYYSGRCSEEELHESASIIMFLANHDGASSSAFAS
jgi:hypothetical protein